MRNSRAVRARRRSERLTACAQIHRVSHADTGCDGGAYIWRGHLGRDDGRDAAAKHSRHSGQRWAGGWCAMLDGGGGGLVKVAGKSRC